MAIDNLEIEVVDADGEEVEVNFEGELISALEEIQRLRKKNKEQKELLVKNKVEAIEPCSCKLKKARC